MPKVKTHKGAASRFKLTKSGKAIRAKAYHNHMLEKKTSDRKRGSTKNLGVSSADYKNVKKLIRK